MWRGGALRARCTFLFPFFPFSKVEKGGEGEKHARAPFSSTHQKPSPLKKRKVRCRGARSQKRERRGGRMNPATDQGGGGLCLRPASQRYPACLLHFAWLAWRDEGARISLVREIVEKWKNSLLSFHLGKSKIKNRETAERRKKGEKKKKRELSKKKKTRQHHQAAGGSAHSPRPRLPAFLRPHS